MKEEHKTLNQQMLVKTWKNISHNYSYVISFVVLFLVAVIISPTFLKWSSIENLFIQGGIIGICALSMGMVITCGMIDLSIGSVVAITSSFAIIVINKTNNLFLGLAFSIVFAIFAYLITSLLITKGKIAPFIATLATMSAYRSIITQLGQGGPFNISPAQYDPLRIIASGKFFGIPNLALIFIVLTVVIAIIMGWTKFGKYIYAVGSNPTAARLAGISVDRVKIQVFFISGILVGIASFLYASRLTCIQASNAGLGFELDAIAAVAIGGTSMDGGRGKVVGTFLGVLMLRMVNMILIMANIPPFLNGLVSGIIIVLAVILQRKKQ